MSKTSAATFPALAGSSLVAMATGAMLWLLLTAALAAGCSSALAAPAVTQITMSSCDRAGCELVFRFPQPVPGARVEFDPPQAGAQRWTSENELTFTPAPGALGWGHQITARVGVWSRSFVVPYFEAAGKVASWPVIAGKPRFIAFLGGREQIGRGPLFLLYDQKVDPHAVSRHIGAQDSQGRPVAVRVWRPARVEGYDGPIDGDLVVALRLPHPPASGTQLKLSVPGYVEGERVLDEHSFQVLTDFRIGRSGKEQLDRAPQQLELRLRSTTPVSGAALSEALRITPRPSRLYVYGDDHELYVSASLPPGTAYRFELPRGFRDALGNRLQQPFRLRVQAQDLPPSLHVPGGPLVVERGRARLPILGVNIGRVRAELHRFESPAQFVGQGAICQGPVAFRAKGRGAGKMNRKAGQDLPLAGVKPGLYCVDVIAGGRGSEAGGEMRGSMKVQISNIGATAKVYAGRVLAWVTQLDDPRPLSRARVSVMDESGTKYGAGVTAKDGVAVLDAPPADAEGVAKKLFLLVQHRDDAAVLELSNDRLSQAWKFSLPGVVAGAKPLAAAVFTDRGAYRPGETAHVKMIVRDPMSFRIPPEGEVDVSVQDSRGQKVLEKTLALDMLGSADLEVPVKEGAPVGEYTVRVAQGERFAVRHFRVEEYRVPTFEVIVTAQESEWKPGGEIHAEAEAKYLHGGVLGGREVKWQVTAAREPFAPAAFPGFTFGDVGAADGQVASGEGKLDGAGKISFSFKSDAHGGPVRFVAEATVTDVDRQAYAGRLSHVVHPASVYVGVRQPAERVLGKGEVLEVPLVAVRPDGSAQAGVEVRAVLSRVDYHTVARLAADSVQLLSRPVYAEGEECVAVTTQTGAVCRFLVESAGEHSLVARARDASAGFTFVASGRNGAAWPRFDRERIELVADKPSYQPGDIARLVVQTPYPVARGLLTLERDGVLEHRLFRIDGDTPALEVKIAERHAPNIFASVVILRGRVHGEKDAAGLETGAPGFRIGYANLRVEPAGHRLAVKVEPSARTAAPGEKLGISLHAGRRGQATVWVVDEALLGLTRYRTPDALGEIFSPRALAVRTGESRLELFANRRARREEIFPAGDGGEGFSQQQPPLELRNLFQSTAYWNGSVPLDDSGNAFVELKLPDNLTTWRVMAVAYDKDGRTGSGDAKVTVRKPVMVSPVLPRFVYPGDQLELSAQVFNGTDSAGEAQIEASFDGKPQPRTSLQIEPGQSRLTAWPIIVTGRGAITVRYTARIGKDADAVEVKLPILVPGNRRVMVAQQNVSGDAELSLHFPDDRQPGSAKAEVVVSSTSLSALKGAVDYLMEYPNGCIEQTTSTAYPLVVLKDLLPEIGVTVNEADLKKFSEAGVKRILSFQTEKGGLSYWPGGREPHAFATAFGLTALIEAKKRGYDVPDEKLARMADFLEWSLKQGKISGEMPHAALPDGDTRALFVMTLGRMGRPQPAWINTLWRNKEQVSPFGLALLAVAVQEQPGDKSLLAPLLAEVEKASQKNSDQAWYTQERKGGWSMDSPLRTHAGALLAFAEGGRREEMTPKLLEGLLHRQRGGMWGNTQENVFGIMGVAALAGASEAPGEAPRMELRIGDRRLQPEDLEPVSKRVRRLSMTERELPLPEMRVKLHNGAGTPLFFTVRGEYEAQLTPKNRAARSNGFSLERRYELLDGTPLEGRTIPLGQLVRVKLSVRAAEAQNYVAIDDKLPAGLEPLNAGLATTGSVAQGKTSPGLERGLAALSYSEVRDARVAFFADEMPAGDYEFDYVARATTAGHFLRPAASVEAMYLPEKSGATAIDEVEIR